MVGQKEKVAGGLSHRLVEEHLTSGGCRLP